MTTIRRSANGTRGRNARQFRLSAVIVAMAAAAVVVPAAAWSSASPTASADVLAPAFPDAETTGVPSTVTLRKFPTSNPTLNVAGAVYDGYRFDGVVSVTANNVTIKNSLIVGRVNAGRSDTTQQGLVIQDTTIDASLFHSTTTTTPPAVSFRNFTLNRVEIFGSGHGVQATVNVVVENSWIHNLCCENAGHKDAIITNGGNHISILHNNIDSAVFNSSGAPVLTQSYVSAAIGLFGDFAPLDHITIENNLINTVGSYCMYGGDSASKKYPTSTYMVVRNNAFGRKYHPTGGIWGPVGNWTTNAGDVWSGNYWTPGNLAITR